MMHRLFFVSLAAALPVLTTATFGCAETEELDPSQDVLDGVDDEDPALAQEPPEGSAGKADGAIALPAYGGGKTVHLRFAGFIPCDVLGPGRLGEGVGDFTDFYLEGDNRGFSFAGARDQSRASASALISKTRIESAHEHVGTSRAFRNDVVRASGDAWSPFARCFTVESGGAPYFEHTDTTPEINTWHSTADSNETWTLTKTTFRLRATGQTPVGEFPCSLDGVGDLYVWWDNAGNARHFDVRVDHDAFPAYELYINERPVFRHDPRQTGHSPLDLCLSATQVQDRRTGTIG